jgi:hypothetical protein
MIAAAKARAPVRTGFLRKNIAMIQRVYQRGGTRALILGVKTKQFDARTGEIPSKILHLLEWGTSAHDIFPKHKKALKFKGGGIEGSEGTTDVWTMWVRHQGTSAIGFMRRAFDGHWRDFIRILQVELRRNLSRALGMKMR